MFVEWERVSHLCVQWGWKWSDGHDVRLHSDLLATLRKGPSPKSPATGRWGRETEGGSGPIQTVMGLAQSPAQGRARLPAPLSRSLEASGQGGLCPSPLVSPARGQAEQRWGWKWELHASLTLTLPGEGRTGRAKSGLLVVVMCETKAEEKLLNFFTT